MSDATDHADAFATLSDPTRVAILRALWEHEEPAVSFSELREAVGAADSGRFNYHLGKLTDGFVTKSDEGYRLRWAGIDVVGSLIAGTYQQGDPITDVSFDPCPRCGTETTLAYDGEAFTVTCPTHDALVRLPAPPSVVSEDDPATLRRVAREYTQSTLADVRSGFCIYCESPTDSTVLPMSAVSGVTDGDRDVPMVRHDCASCGESVANDLKLSLATHPAVVSFYYDHGVDVRDCSPLRFMSIGDDCSTVTSDDPVRAHVSYSSPATPSTDADRPTTDASRATTDRPAAEVLELVVDESATVREATRVEERAATR